METHFFRCAGGKGCDEAIGHQAAFNGRESFFSQSCFLCPWESIFWSVRTLFYFYEGNLKKSENNMSPGSIAPKFTILHASKKTKRNDQERVTFLAFFVFMHSLETKSFFKRFFFVPNERKHHKMRVKYVHGDFN